MALKATSRRSKKVSRDTKKSSPRSLKVSARRSAPRRGKPVEERHAESLTAVAAESLRTGILPPAPGREAEPGGQLVEAAVQIAQGARGVGEHAAPGEGAHALPLALDAIGHRLLEGIVEAA